MSTLPSSARILVVEDDPGVRELLRLLLIEAGDTVVFAESGEAAVAALGGGAFDVVLVDLQLPGMTGMTVLATTRILQPDAQCIVITGFASVDSAVEAMRQGAFDYVSKPFHPDELLFTLQRALGDAGMRREISALRERAGAADGIIGESPIMRRLRGLVQRVASSHATVLVTGETGTGKELVARAIHDLSPRARRPFVAVQCSALSESLLESELFGHMKGSFTGAVANRRGLIEEAHGGTLLLDEISTISPAVQVKLLRAIQERRVKRIGGSAEIDVDFRLVAACNVDLGREVAAGRFRQDLYYRLNVVQVEVPPLRERPDDIPLLAEHFRLRATQRHGLRAPAFAPGVLERLMVQPWPGNVRELENYVERAVVLYADAGAIPFHLPPGVDDGSRHALLERAHDETWTLAELERAYIVSVLAEQGGHRGRTAQRLGIDRRTLFRKLRETPPAGTAVTPSYPPAGSRPRYPATASRASLHRG